MGAFLRFFKILNEGLRFFVKLTAPVFGIAIALPVSSCFFILYLGVETANLSAAQFNKLLGVGAATLFKNPTLNAMSEFTLGIVQNIWTKYALGPLLDLARTGFEKTEKAFADKGLENRDDRITGFAHDSQKGRSLSNAAYRKDDKNNSQHSADPKTSPSTKKSDKARALDESLAKGSDAGDSRSLL